MVGAGSPGLVQPLQPARDQLGPVVWSPSTSGRIGHHGHPDSSAGSLGPIYLSTATLAFWSVPVPLRSATCSSPAATWSSWPPTCLHPRESASWWPPPTARPVYHREVDNVIGIAHLVDLIDARDRVADHVRPTPTCRSRWACWTRCAASRPSGSSSPS